LQYRGNTLNSKPRISGSLAAASNPLAGRVVQHNGKNDATPVAALSHIIPNSTGSTLALIQSLSSRNNEHAMVTI
jgi:hypothetical protein